MIVKENISFKREPNSKKNLELGFYRSIDNPTLKDLLSLSEGLYLLTAVNDSNVNQYLVGRIFYDNDIFQLRIPFTWDTISPESAKKHWIKSNYQGYMNSWNVESADKVNFINIRRIDMLGESMEFKRGLTSKKSMEIGDQRVIKNPTAAKIKGLSEGLYMIFSGKPPPWTIVHFLPEKMMIKMIPGSWEYSEQEAIINWKSKRYYEIYNEVKEKAIDLFFERYKVEKMSKIS